MTIELPARFAVQLHQCEILLDLAVGMYAARQLTLGQAAELAGIPQALLQRELGQGQIPAHYDLDDLAHDLSAAAELVRS